QLPIQRSPAGRSVRHLAERLRQRGVVSRDGGLVLRVRAPKLALQTLGIEDRKRNRGSDASDTGPCRGEVMNAEGLEAREPEQVQARVDPRLGLIDAPRGGFGARTSRDDVRPSPEELQSQVLGQPLRTGELCGWTGDCETAVRTRTEERRNGIPLQAYALIDR